LRRLSRSDWGENPVCIEDDICASVGLSGARIGEDGDAAIGKVGGRADSFDPGGGEGGMVSREIVGMEKEGDAPPVWSPMRVF